MSRNKSQIRGLALGAIFALLTSLFGAVPAQAAATEGSNIAIRPVSGTTFGGMVYNEFDVYAQLLPGQSNAAFSTSLEWKVEVTSGYDMDVMYHVDNAAITVVDQDTDSSSPGTIPVIAATPTASLASASFAAFGASTVSSGLSYLTLKAHSTSGALTWSKVTIKITAWIDEVTVGDGITTGDGVIDADEWYTEETITLYNAATVPFTANWTAPNALDTAVTASATITGVNFAALGAGKFFLAVSSSEALLFGPSVGQQDSSSPLAGSVLAARSGVISSSWTINAISESQSVSFDLRYDPAGTGGSYTAGHSMGTSTSYAAIAPGIDTLSVSATANANISGSGTAYTVRANETYTIKVFAATGSTSVSKAVNVVLGGTTLVTSSTLISINGGDFVTAYPADGITVTTDTDGYGSFTIGTSGFVENDTLTIAASVGNVEASTVTLTVKDPTYIVDSAYDIYVTKPGTAVAVAYTVNDQWGESSAASNHYLKVTRGGTGFAYATTVSYLAVSGGAATLNFTPEAATTTGSATVDVQVVKRVNGAYVNDGSAKSVTVNVSSTADSFGTGLAASYSASISYFPNTVSWTTVTGKVLNTGSAVVVAGDGLVFRQSAAVPATSSGGITVRGDGSLNYTFDVASLLEGSFTMTLTTGANATSSLLVVDAAAHDSGKSIEFDTTNIVPGRTKIVTGTVKDANGNPVATGDTASIVVTYTGTAGIPVGSMPTATDADGNFKVSILTSAADNGSIVLTAVYNKDGASTTTANKVTKVQTITVGAAASEAAADTKVNAGSFKGYVAIYAKGYAGQRLSAKVGNDWVVVESLDSNFERVVEYTGAGYTIAVRIYIDRVLVDTITVTTK